MPFPKPAKSTERVRLVGIVNVLRPDDPEAQVRLKIFEQALQEFGWELGRNLKIEIRQIGGDIDRIRRYAAEIVALKPDVILTVGSIAVGALQQETHSIPIVFVNAPDPVGAGFVQNMSHPGGNITGFSNFEYSMSGKWGRIAQAGSAPNYACPGAS
jgi:putative ABC transport system substrate-binding protein